MLLPISHEKMTVRRLPLVTLALIALTILLHGFATIAARSQSARVDDAAREAARIYLAQPALGVCPPLEPFADVLLAALSKRVDTTPSPGDAPSDDAAASYANACKTLGEELARLPAERFGYIPARANLLGLFTSMFVHVSWLHVLSNMWFLFLCGLALEDRWGRPAFLAFYLVAGVAAAGVHHLALPHSTAPVVGASGAIAGLMGAFVVLFARTKIRFVGLLGFRLVSFMAPAYVMLPLWVAVELLFGSIGEASDTAHWAHVGGFVFGASVAGLFRLAGVDRRLDAATEVVAVLGDDPRIATARMLVAKGAPDQAVALLEGLREERPGFAPVEEALRSAREAAAAHAAMPRASTVASKPDDAPFFPAPTTRK